LLFEFPCKELSDAIVELVFTAVELVGFASLNA